MIDVIKNFKQFKSDYYNYIFDMNTGFFARWGKNQDDDPMCAPFPEILDLEVSDVCSGPNGKNPCPWCYKSNTSDGYNMSFDQFKNILDKMLFLTQVAFGIGDLDANKDLWKMMEYCRSNRIIPNITINGFNLTDEYTDKLAALCGAVSVSRYALKDVCYDAVYKLTSRINDTNFLKQVNIHHILSEETYDRCFSVIDDVKNDNRLSKLNAVVFLLLKPKGNRNTLTVLNDVDKYKKLIEYGKDKRVGIGFDSCSGPLFLKATKNNKDFQMCDMLCECCESSLFSAYINTYGKFFPCSFTEGETGWVEGLDVLTCDDFTEEIWNHPKTIEFRKSLLNQTSSLSSTYRECPVFNLY